MSIDREVLVAVSNPDHVEQLVRTAGDLARMLDGRIRLISVVVKSHDSPFEMLDDETIRRKYSGDRQALLDRATKTAPTDVPVEAELVVARSVAGGVLRAAAESGVEAVLLGWHGPTRRSSVVLGTSVDTVLRHAPCDVYVERIGRVADGVDRVLLPVADGPHVQPATTIARAVAAANDATVTAVSVVDPDTDSEVAEEWLTDTVETFAASPGFTVEIETEIREADDVADALVEMAASYDVLVFGVTRRGGLRARLVGSIPRQVANRTNRTVILSRAADAGSGRLSSLVDRFDPRRGSE